MSTRPPPVSPSAVWVWGAIMGASVATYATQWPSQALGPHIGGYRSVGGLVSDVRASVTIVTSARGGLCTGLSTGSGRVTNVTLTNELSPIGGTPVGMLWITSTPPPLVVHSLWISRVAVGNWLLPPSPHRPNPAPRIVGLDHANSRYPVQAVLLGIRVEVDGQPVR